MSDSAPPIKLEENVPLSERTTLGVGGPVKVLARCSSQEHLHQALEEAEALQLPVFVLGGGSNLLVADEGFPGLALQLSDESLEIEEDGDAARLRAGAGLSWDRLVEAAVDRGFAGIECLSGIPGLVGAAPIQNIGAYGQEIADVLASVEVLDRQTGEAESLPSEACAFGYRTSRFKAEDADRFIVTAVTLRLPRHGRGAVRYGDLARRFPRAAEDPPTVAAVRQAVLEVRRFKSMVIEATPPGEEPDPNRRSAGSFFMNPVVTPAQAEEVAARVARLRGPEAAEALPRYPAEGGAVKLAAAWLIENAGFHRGYSLGPAALSTRHTLALVNRGGAQARDLLRLAARIRRRVREAFGVTLNPEPVFLGFSEPPDTLLDRLAESP